MRDKLIHDYIDVDLNEVWKTATEDTPQLQQQIKKIITST
ncbi:MAG: HepT-like ribonuclease domain-containing protein [Saprospiraceae bacterium]